MRRSLALTLIFAIMISCAGGIGVELAVYTMFGPGNYAGVWTLPEGTHAVGLHMSDSASATGAVSLAASAFTSATTKAPVSKLIDTGVVDTGVIDTELTETDIATIETFTGDFATDAPLSDIVIEEIATPTNYYEDMPELPLPQYVMDMLYSPFYVIDVDFGDKYSVKSNPGGSDVAGEVFGQQVGVNVVGTEDGWTHITANRYPGGRPIEGYVPEKRIMQVTPDDRYSIVIDKLEQRLYLFEYGKLIDEMLCSTGKTTTETPAGEFIKMGNKATIVSDSDPDVAYDAIRINGRVYIHSVSEIDGDYSESTAMLGRKASHGCIRVPLDKAEWFYNEIPDNTKVIVLEYRGETPELGEGGRGNPDEQYIYPEPKKD